MKKLWLFGIICSAAAIHATADAQQYAQSRMNGRPDTRLINYQDDLELEPERPDLTSQRVSEQLKSEYGQPPQSQHGPMLAPPMTNMAPASGYNNRYQPAPSADCGCGNMNYTPSGNYIDRGCSTGNCGGNDCGCGAMGGNCGCGSTGYQGYTMGRGIGGCDTGYGQVAGRHARYMGRGRDTFIGGRNTGACGSQAAGGRTMGYGYDEMSYGDAGCGPIGYDDGYGQRGSNLRGRGYGGGGLGILDRGCDTYTVVGGGWLLMKRDGADFQPLSYETGMPANQLSVSDANIEAQNGLEMFFARQSNDGRGWEMRYWGLTEGNNSATLGNMPQTELGGLSSISVATYGSAWGIFNAADTHRISRESDLHNAEFNFLRYASSCGSRGNIVFRGIGGLRVLRFNDSMSYTAEGAGYFGSYGFNSIKLHSSVANTMIAAQVGGTGEYCLSDRLRLAFGSKVGIGGNSIDADQCLVSSNGVFGRNPSGNDYSYMNSESDFAMFGEFNTNIYYHITESCRISVGYRLFGVSGVALAQQQLPYDFTDVNEINSINRDGGLLLQGLTLGAEFCR